jgi:hypothetical protein
MIVNDFVRLYNETTEEDSERLKRLPYKRFLQTDYWLTVSSYVKQRDNNKCVQCGETRNLNVHHLTYDNRGYEYRTHETDLITLCEECHSAIHNIKIKPSKKPKRIKTTSKIDRRKDRKAVEAIRQDLAKILVKQVELKIAELDGISRLGIGTKQVKTMRVEALIRLASRLGLNVEICVFKFDKKQGGMVSVS